MDKEPGGNDEPDPVGIGNGSSLSCGWPRPRISHGFVLQGHIFSQEVFCFRVGRGHRTVGFPSVGDNHQERLEPNFDTRLRGGDYVGDTTFYADI
jgi:hypothetical protein